MDKTIEKELPEYKIGNDILVTRSVITYDEDTKIAVDAMTARERAFIDKITKQASLIQTLETSLTIEKESMKTLKTAQDTMIAADSVDNMVSELLDVRQTAEKIGLDCASEINAHDIKKKVLKKLLPEAYKSMETKKVLGNKEAVDAAYEACKQNMGFHRDVNNTIEALKGNKGLRVTQPSSSHPVFKSFEQFGR